METWKHIRAVLLLPFLATVIILGNMIYMPLVEEPGLVKRFGKEYDEYRRNVPRWLPRMRAWNKNEAPNL